MSGYGSGVWLRWTAFVSWFTGEPVEYVRCPTKHAFRDARLKWTEEVAEFYEECTTCGKEFYDD